MKPHKRQILLRLFVSTLYLSAFTFGGGYVIVTLLKNKFVDQYHWIEEDEMLDLVAIAQSSPGAVAVNGSIIVGYRLAGIAGAAVSVLGAILPPMLFLSVISVFYDAFSSQPSVAALLGGMRAGVGAVIVSAVWDMEKKVAGSRDTAQTVILVVSFVLSCFCNVNVLWILLGAAAFGLLRALWEKKQKGGRA